MSTIESDKKPSLRCQRGLSLVELMISLTIGLILLAGITALIVQQSGSRDELEKSSRQIENGRYAIQLLRDEIEHAGYFGEFYSMPAPPPVLPDPCDSSTGGLGAAISLPVQGYDFNPSSTATSPITACLAAANYKPGTDILVLRRTSTVPESGLVSVTNPPEILMQTTAASYVVATVTTAINIATPPLPEPFTLTVGGVTPAAMREYLVRIYFISPCNVPSGGGTVCTGAADDNGNPVPTLKRLDIAGPNRTDPPTPVPLVEGIENMQLDYGLDSNGDGYPDLYTTAPASTLDWSNVMAIRVHLLARNNDPTTNFADNKTYTLGLAGSVGPFNAAPYALSPACGGTASYPQLCNYKRHVFSELVRVINPSGRRARQ